MTPPFTLDTYREGISQVAISVYETMLVIALRPAREFEALPRNSFTGAVCYAGTWEGALLLECSCEQAMDWAPEISPSPYASRTASELFGSPWWRYFRSNQPLWVSSRYP